MSQIIVLAPPITVAQTEAWDRNTGLSGVEINQNRAPTTVNDFVVANGGNYYYQTFALPQNYKRASTIAPDITGFQLCVTLADPDNLQLNYKIDTFKFNTWQTISSGEVSRCHAAGDQIWIDVYLDESIVVNDYLINRLFRIGFNTQNIDKVWYSNPNPLTDTTIGVQQAYTETAPLVSGGSFMFRLLTASGDSGQDFLGNSYRSVVVRNSPKNLSTQASPDPYAYWLSKPNPSKFAVETLYVDVRDSNGNAQVVDRILVNPTTPGPYMHVYYTTEDSPTNSLSDWDNKLWSPVPKSYRLLRRTEFALPEPITAKYICLEFSYLQAMNYAPGTFAQAITYRKYPKWVLDYFLENQSLQATSSNFVADTVNIVYDLLQFAFDYYLDDLQQKPLDPAQLSTDFQSFLSPNQLDNSTFLQIYTNLNQYSQPAGSRARPQSYLISEFVTNSVSTNNSPVEVQTVPLSNIPTAVSSTNRDDLILEANWPQMFFIIQSRHAYKEIQAHLDYDRAYFIGIRELAFLRDNYTVANDTPLYIETTGDNVNTRRNDFINTNRTWTVGQGPVGGQA